LRLSRERLRTNGNAMENDGTPRSAVSPVRRDTTSVLGRPTLQQQETPVPAASVAEVVERVNDVLARFGTRGLVMAASVYEGERLADVLLTEPCEVAGPIDLDSALRHDLGKGFRVGLTMPDDGSPTCDVVDRGQELK
jgi:hypothetical protein